VDLRFEGKGGLAYQIMGAIRQRQRQHARALEGLGGTRSIMPTQPCWCSAVADIKV
jgi:hypothetical protein